MSLPDIDELRTVMDRYEITQSQLARKVTEIRMTRKSERERKKLTKSQLSKIFSKTVNPSYNTVRDLWEALNELTKEQAKRCRELIANRKLVTAQLDDPIASVIDKMKRNDFSQIPVVSNREFRGVVTEGSLMQRAQDAVSVRDVLGAGFAVVEPDDASDKARRLLKHCQAVVVVENGTLLGILTKSDFLGS